MNVGDIPSHLPPLDDYLTTVPGNTNFPGLDTSSSPAGIGFDYRVVSRQGCRIYGLWCVNNLPMVVT